jgi:multiple sugar transport system permease protein
MVSTAFKVDQDIFKFPPDLLPSPLNLANFPAVFENAPMVRAMFNSTKIAVLATAGTVFTSSLAAYAFAKIKFRMKNVLFILFLATLMIPGQVTLIPLYILFSRIGWIDTHWPLIIPPVMINTYGVFLLRQFMLGIPDAYVESAKLDGANHFRIYWNIMLPLCKPALVTLALFSFIGSWNNFLGPLIFLSTDTQFTVPLIINSFRTIYYVQWGLLMAAATIAVLPILVLYLFGQRFFIEGITLAGLKG